MPPGPGWAASSPGRLSAASGNWTSGYVPDGVAGLTAAFPLSAVRLLDSPMRANQARNTSYLMFVDPDRLLHTFRLNYGLPSSARPCGGWEAPGSLVRGHYTGHLMSGLALTYANTGNQAAADKGAYLVEQLARCQARDRARWLPRRVPVGLPGDLLRPARSGPAGLVALLHDPQDHGRADRPA